MSKTTRGATVGTDSVPCPRQAWGDATEGSRVSITVDAMTGRTMTFSGRVTERRKNGTEHRCHVTIQFTPDGELAPVEIEAERERGEWGPFRAFMWTVPQDPMAPDTAVYQYMGQVSALDITPGQAVDEPPRGASVGHGGGA